MSEHVTVNQFTTTTVVLVWLIFLVVAYMTFLQVMECVHDRQERVAVKEQELGRIKKAQMNTRAFTE